MKKTIYETILPNGEKISKADKLLASTGTLEELSAFLDITKHQYLSESKSSCIYLFAKFTEFQEAIDAMIQSLLTSKKNNGRYENTRFVKTDFLKNLEKDSRPNFQIIKSLTFQSTLLYIRTLIRKAERQVIASKNLQLGMVPEEEIIVYLNLLEKYFKPT